jgi:hypothetical protein
MQQWRSKREQQGLLELSTWTTQDGRRKSRWPFASIFFIESPPPRKVGCERGRSEEFLQEREIRLGINNRTECVETGKRGASMQSGSQRRKRRGRSCEVGGGFLSF